MDNMDGQLVLISLKKKAAYLSVMFVRICGWLYVLAWVALLGTLLYYVLEGKGILHKRDVIFTLILFLPVVGSFVARINKKLWYQVWRVVHLAFEIVLLTFYREGYAGSDSDFVMLFLIVNGVGLVVNEFIFRTANFYAEIRRIKKAIKLSRPATFRQRRVVAIGALATVIGLGVGTVFIVKSNHKPSSPQQAGAEFKQKKTVSVSFDCAKASNDVEKIICDPENGSLHEADRRMAELYKKSSNGLKSVSAAWIQESQSNWLHARKQCAYSWCLEMLYNERIEELENGIVANPILKERLPLRVTLPGGQVCLFVLEEYRLGKTDNGKGVNVQQKLIYRRDGIEQVLWEGRGVDYDDEEVDDNYRFLKSISLIALSNNQVVMQVEEEISQNYLPDNRITGWARHYLALVGDNSFAFQGSKEMTTDEEYMHGNHGSVNLMVLAGELGLEIKDRYAGNSYYPYNPLNQQLRYRFRFDGQAWEAQLPEPQQWLEKPDAAKRYSDLYAEIVNHITTPVTEGACVESGIDWALASDGLYQWMSVVEDAYDRGVAYKDASVIISMVLDSKEHPVMTNSQRELFRAINHIRGRLEATKNWEQRMMDTYNTSKESGNLDNLGDMMKEAFPAINVECAGQYSTMHGYDFDDWLYTFWVRRELDGTYDIAKRVIDYSVDDKH